ncbi:MAG TPA: hypothetical protein ENI64_04000 [Gammaproteobacteria bacterium]|nr:hypothetical protein [Gammaproteobacteria bacterium]
MKSCFSGKLWRYTASISAAAVFLLATGCGGGSGGTLGGSQSRDPIVKEIPILYVKRTLPVDNNGNLIQTDVRQPADFSPGGDLWLRSAASPSSPERNLTGSITGGMGDVRDLSISYDGSQAVFALRLPDLPNTQPENQPTWNIWLYDVATDSVNRVITSDIVAEEGQDIAPQFLPDGRILYTSTRQKRTVAILLDEGKPQFAPLDEDRQESATVLHVMDADGSNIKQISFNQSHDLDPTVTLDGRVVYSRWDNTGRRNEINLYSMNPDGTDMRILYGAHSHNTGTNNTTVQFLQPYERDDGLLQVLARPFTGTQGGGNLINIDIGNFVDNTIPTWPNQGMLGGTAQSPAIANLPVTTTTGPSPSGRFASAFPLWDGTGRLLVSWSICRLIENGNIVPCTPARLAAANPVEAPPLYGLFIYDPGNQTMVPIVAPTEGLTLSEIALMQPRTAPAVISDLVPAINLANERVGILHIRSVYDLDGVDNTANGITTLADPALTTADQRPARFLRIEKAASIPDRNTRDFRNTAFGPDRNQLMREILAYAPIEPDGSVMVKVPAEVPLAISVLDKNGRRLNGFGRHLNWIQVRPGETVTCSGCHNHNAITPQAHATPDGPPSINPGAPVAGGIFPNTMSNLWAFNAGETMAEVRASQDATALDPLVDIVFDDVWTDPVTAGRAADTSFSYSYSDLTTAIPTSATCMTNWSSSCRITINYEQHIHPLWNVNRQVLDINGTLIRDDTCTSCHNIADAAMVAMVPKGDLDLTDGPSDQQPDHFKSYRELLFGDNAQAVVGGVVVDLLVPAVDASGNPLFLLDANGNQVLDANGAPIPLPPVTVPARGPSMSANGANSRYFMSKFDAGSGDPIHSGILADGELKMISEWLDIGAQYYNDPFMAPLN